MNKRIRKKHSGNYVYVLDFVSLEDDYRSCGVYLTLEKLHNDLTRIKKLHSSIGTYITHWDARMDDMAKAHDGDWPVGRYNIKRIKLNRSIALCPDFKNHIDCFTAEEGSNPSSDSFDFF